MRSFVIAQIAIVTARQHEEPPTLDGAEALEGFAQAGQRLERGVNVGGQVGPGAGIEEVAGDHHDRDVIGVAEEVQELLHGAARGVRRRRKRQVAHDINVVTEGNRVSSSFSGGHAIQSRRDGCL